jgi:drug/metabolite transporter (DMT)-like permease
MLFGSAFAFSGVTVLMKLAIDEGMSPPTAAFLRFAVGLVGILPLVIRNRKRLVPNRPWLVFLRGLSNSGAVLLVFTALSLTTVTKTNLLNMTAPVFVFALAPLLNRERSPLLYFLLLIVTLAGSFLVVLDRGAVSFASVNLGDLLAMISAVLAGVGLSILREARKHDSSIVILFYMFGIGTVATGIAVLGSYVPVTRQALLWALAGSGCSLVAQILLTVGYRHVPASEGSLISASRILIAAVLGYLVFGDLVTLRTFLGGSLILASLATIGVHSRREESGDEEAAVGTPSGV